MIPKYQIEKLKKDFLKDYQGKELTGLKLKYDFIKYQEANNPLFKELTGAELIKIALEYGIKVKGYEINKIEIIKRKKDITKEELKKLYVEQKLSVREISKKYELCKDKIYDLMKDFGIELRQRPVISKEVLIKMRKNTSIDDVCKKLDISNSYYYYLIEKYGIEKTNKKIRRAS